MSREQNPWAQFALLSYLAEKLGDTGLLGKKAIQKYVYILQELGKIPNLYKFKFYTYGPYSSDLSGDLDVSQTLGGVDIKYDRLTNSYSIAKGPYASDVMERGQSFVDKNKTVIDAIVGQFGGRYAKNLELTATIVYLMRNCDDELGSNEQSLVENVILLKPKYTSQEVYAAIDELKKLGYFNQLAKQA